MQRKTRLTKEEKQKKVKEKTVISQEEANSLEQRIKKEGEEAEENEDIKEIREFLRGGNSESQKFSPSLEKTNAIQRIPVRLERTIADETSSVTTTTNNTNRGDELSYIPSGVAGEEKKYLSHYGPVEETISLRDLQNVKPSEKREVRFQLSSDASMTTNNSIEKYTFIAPKRVDVENLGREKSLVKKDIKYTPSERY